MKKEPISASVVMSTPPQSLLPAPAAKRKVKVKRLNKMDGSKKGSAMSGCEEVETVQVKVNPVKGSKLSENPSKSDMGLS